jgi:hypothetical protein
MARTYILALTSLIADGLLGRQTAYTISESGGGMSPYGKDINSFVDACKLLLNAEIVAAELTPQQNQVIQYYIAALIEKFPALLK